VGREKRQLWLLPRDHFKSTILTVGYAIQCILNDPYQSNLILSSKEEHAVAFSDEIRFHFTNNLKLKSIFGPWCADKDFGASGKWDSPAKAFFGGKRREPTMVATGFKAALESRHYKRGFFDDVITVDDITETGIVASVANFKKAVPLIDKDGWIIMPGTRKAYNDLYSYVIDSGAYTIYARHGLQHKTKTCDLQSCASTASPHPAPDMDGDPLEPARYDRKDYAQKLRECEIDPKAGVSFFWHEYMNVPFSPSDRKFQPEWFVQVDDDMIPGKREPFAPLNKYIALDSAWKDDEHPSGYDYTAIEVGGFDEFGRLYILEMLRSREWTMKQGSDALITLMKAYGISRVITEKVGQITFHPYFRDRARQAGIPVVFITPKRAAGGGGKRFKQRIMVCQGFFEQGKIFFRRGIDNFEACRDEFCNLGRWTNDDLADAMADFFDEQVKQMAPVAQGSQMGKWHGAMRPVQSDSPDRHAAFRRFSNKADPLGRFGALGPAVIKSKFDIGHFEGDS
jgi:hypothetical protein